MVVICTTLNAKYIHTNLAIRYLKAYAEPEYHVELAEYTIKDPAMNIVTDLFRKSRISLVSAVIFGTLKKRLK